MDNKKNAIDALTSMANNIFNKKSDAAKLREVFYYVELALVAGVRREKVLETIRDTLGVKMSLKAFDKNLYTIRKKQKHEKRPDLTNTQVVLATKQPASIEGIENDQNHDNNTNSWKDRMNGEEIYNKLYALGDAHSKEQKRIEKEKKYEQARLKRLGKI